MPGSSETERYKAAWKVRRQRGCVQGLIRPEGSYADELLDESESLRCGHCGLKIDEIPGETTP